MGDPEKLIVSQTIIALEQGEFQEFCLDFLPLYDDRFKGLKRFGGTAAGKTRPGTPDLIKTCRNGDQIGVQCSVRRDYWKQPTEADVTGWKPCDEIVECTQNLDRPVEIVLCSSQEVPTNRQNAESRIKQFARSKTNALITIFVLPDFEQELVNNPAKYKLVNQKHLTRYAAILEALEFRTAPSQSEITLEVYKQRSVPLNEAERIAEKVIQCAPDGVDLKELAIKEAAKLSSRFERVSPPRAPDVKRVPVNQLFGKDLAGHVFGLVGVPKIGKTSYAAQLCAEIDKEHVETLWFEPPILPEVQGEFCRDLSRALLSRLSEAKTANEFADGKLSGEQLSQRLSGAQPGKGVQLLIDDVGHLTQATKRQIDTIIEAIRSSPLKPYLGVVLVSNKSLKGEFKQLDAEFMSPLWNEKEIHQLLENRNIKIQGSVADYARVLADFSGSHPLVAIALARKAPSISKLLVSELDKKPALHDEELTEEVKELLFKELLPDDDTRDFFLRMCVLVFAARGPLLRFLAERIAPPLRSPYLLMLDGLKGEAIEGDEAQGLQVRFVFRKVASQYVDADKQKNIHKQIGQFLLTPQDSVLDAGQATEGITYLILAGEVGQALAWTSHLLLKVGAVDARQTSFLLDRLFLVEAMTPPDRPEDRLRHQIALWQIATAYSNLGNSAKAVVLLDRILAHRVDGLEPAPDSPVPLSRIYASVTIYLALQLSLAGKTEQAVSVLDPVDPANVWELSPKWLLARIAANLVSRAKASRFPARFLYALVKATDPNDDELIDELVGCFLGLGFFMATGTSDLSFSQLTQADNGSSPVLWTLLKEIARAEFALERQNSSEGLRIVDEAVRLARKLEFKSKRLQSKLHQLRGDALFQADKKDEAADDYRASLDLLPSNKTLFDHTWARYRIGLCTSDHEEAFRMMAEASPHFDAPPLQRKKALCEGEKGIAAYKLGRLSDSILAFEGILRGYYTEGRADYAPAAALSLALTNRIKCELEKKAVPTDASGRVIFPALERGLFEKIVANATPKAGPCVAFHSLGQVYGLLGCSQRQVEIQNLCLEQRPSQDLEVKVRVLCGLELLHALTRRSEFVELRRVIKCLFKSTDGSEWSSEDYWVFACFTKAELLLKEGKLKKADYVELVAAFEEAADALSGKRKYWWLAEIYKRKAGMDGVTALTEQDPKHLIRALASSVEGENYPVLLEVSQHMGFSDKPVAKTIKSLAKVHSYLILAICNDGEDIQRLHTAGSNLLKIWPNLQYRRLSEDDLPYWKPLHDGGAELEKTNLGADLKAAVMILLLLSAHQLTKDDKYKEAVTWVNLAIHGKWDVIPPAVRRYLEQ